MTTPIIMPNNYIAIIDDIDSDLAELRWYFHNRYPERKQVLPGNIRHEIKLHLVVFERMTGRPAKDGYVVDHINGNTCDSRRCNLREATKIENTLNRKGNKKNKSGYKGVVFMNDHYRTRPYEAAIIHNKKRYRLGYFATAEQAAMAYNEAARKYHGEYARLNTLPDNITLL